MSSIRLNVLISKFKSQMSKTENIARLEDQKAKIIFVVTKAGLGGAGKYVFDVATAFKDEFDVVVACGGTGPLTEKCDATGIRTLSIDSFQRDVSFTKEFRAFAEFFSILKREQPQIVHLNSSKAGGTGAFAARVYNLLHPKRKCRIIFTAHGWAFKEERGAVQTFLIRLLSWITVLLSHKVITVSEDDRTRALWMPFVTKKLITIRNGTIEPIFKNREESRKRLQIKVEERLIVGIVAELHKNKGLLYALAAIEECAKKNIHLDMYILGEGDDRKQLEVLIHMKDLTDHVHLLGRIPDASMYLYAFDIFLLPSIKEGLPYTILEAGFARLPVIATHVGGIPEVIDDMQSGILIRPRSGHEIADALTLLVHDVEKRKILGEALYEKVSREFTLSRMVADIRGVYTLMMSP